MEKVRIGMVGSKFAADFHADSHSRNPKAEIVAVAAIDNLEEYSKKWGVKDTLTDFKELCRRDDVDLIDVCVPNFLHHDVVLEAAANKKHIICEKPLATTVEDAREMVDFCRKQGVKIMYAEDWIFAPALCRAIELIKEGAIGRMLWVKAKEVHNGSHSEYAKKLEYCGGGALFHIGCHPINWVRHLMGREVVEVVGKTSGGGKSNMIHKDYEGEDWGVALFTFEGGKQGLVEGNYITIGGMDDTVEIYGTKGALKVELTLGSPIHVYSRVGYEYSVEKADNQLGWTRPAVDENWQLGYPAEIDYFIGCLRDDTEPMMGVRGEDGLASMEVAFAAYESMRTGKTIRMKDFRAS